MGKLALYRKYRSSDFDELLGQDHVSSTLDNALKQDKISHAYLFTGPHGIGKTSAARILAARVNKLRKGEESIDIIEIDAASNNGVEEIRELREKVHIAPNYHKYKVYIVDEVHMLSQAAFNALLKTLEEPPAHVIFILATTEPHKLPATIISRTQHFAFRPVSKDTVAEHLKSIAAKESITIDGETAAHIAELSQGSMRDALSLLDQISNSTDEINIQAVRTALGIADNAQVENILQAMEKGNREQVLKAFDSVIDSGTAAGQLLDQLIQLLRTRVRSNAGIGPQVLHDFCSIPVHSQYLDVMIEAILLKHTVTGESPMKNNKPQTAPENVEKPATAPKKSKSPKSTRQESKEAPSKESAQNSGPAHIRLNQSTWVKTLSLIKASDNALYALLRSTEQTFEDDKVTIKCRFQFHYRRLEEPRKRQAITAALKQTTGQVVKVELANYGEPPEVERIESDAETPPSVPAASSVDQVLSIFGGEVL